MEVLLPPVLRVALWLVPVMVVAWVVMSAVGRTVVLRRVDGRLHSRVGTLIVLQAVRVVALLGSFVVWFWCMERVAEMTVMGPVAAGGEPNLVGYFSLVIVATLGLFTLWAVVSWAQAVGVPVQLVALYVQPGCVLHVVELSAAQAEVNVADFEKAEEFLKRAESANPNSYRLHAIRGQMYTIEEHNDQAISEYKLALQNLPESVREGPLYPVGLHLSLSEIYRRTENTDGSESELTAAKASLDRVQNPDPQMRPEYLRLRALIEAGFNDPASAEKDLKEAMSLAPKK